jgi:DNA-binding XRE family transcriptional regulator
MADRWLTEPKGKPKRRQKSGKVHVMGKRWWEMAIDISKELVYRRRERGMTQAELARKAHISKAYICQLESQPGKAPSAEILHRICEVLGTGIENFFHEATSYY